MNDHSNLRAIDEAVIDTALIDILEAALSEARIGALTGIAIIKSYRGGAVWRHAIVGDTVQNSKEALNLRIDLLKRELLNLYIATEDT